MSERDAITRALMRVRRRRGRGLRLWICTAIRGSRLGSLIWRSSSAPQHGAARHPDALRCPRRPSVPSDQSLVDREHPRHVQGHKRMINPDNFDRAWRSWPQSGEHRGRAAADARGLRVASKR